MTLASSPPPSVYAGFDPTAPSLHLGHASVIVMLARMQRLGFRPIALIGGASTLWGPLIAAVVFSVLAETLRLQAPQVYMMSLGLLLILSVAAAGVLAGCATQPAPHPTAEVPYCHKINKGQRIACTEAPAPSLNADVDAKRFTPDPNALTVYVVRRNWGDSRHVVKVQAGYKVQPLSAFLGQPAPAAAPTIDWPALTPAEIGRASCRERVSSPV